MRVDDADRRVLECAAEALLALAKRFLGLPEIGDVGTRPEPFDDVPAAVPDRHPARLEPAVLPVMAADPVLDVVGVVPRNGLQPEAPRRLAVLGVQRLEPAPAQQLALRDAGVLGPL